MQPMISLPHLLQWPVQYLRSQTGTRMVALISLLGLVACGDPEPDAREAEPPGQTPEVAAPVFSGDSAYAYVQKQVDFGPRVPNTPGHQACGDWLVQKFRSFGAKVQTQEMKLRNYQGDILDARNIIASINPDNPTRILLSAHWDTRPWADSDTVDQNKPIPGANDGGSGVAVLLELARQFQTQQPSVGVDIILWDAEDGGQTGDYISWCLGSRHWSENPHKPGYQARFGINLDMVGAENATFTREEFSRRFAPHVLDKVWQTAHQLGHGQYFLYVPHNGEIMDDHFYVNRYGIPMANIIHLSVGQSINGFFEHWHTHGDDMETISAQTLQAVGETVLKVVLTEQPI